MRPIARQAPDTQALEEAAEWLMCLSAGEVSEAEQAGLASWRASSPERERAWQRAERLLGKLGGLPPELALSALERPADPARRAAITRLALLLALAPTGWLGWRQYQQQGWAADYRTTVGERRQLTLADGTRVYLNTDSAIDVRYDAAQRYIHLLRGEILVQSGADNLQRPLRVGTAEGRMQALGTRFTVREREGRTYLAVLEGAVRIEPGAVGEGAFQVVRAGERADFDAHTVGVLQPTDDSPSAWTQGMLLADRMRLDQVLGELSRYHRGVIRCAPQVAGVRVSGAFPVADRQQTLGMLAATYGLSVEQHMGGYWTLVSAR